MRVLFINSVVDFGSTGKIVRSLANGLKKEGHEVLIAYGRHESKNSEDTFYIGNKVGFLIHAVMSRFFGRHGLHSTQSTKRLINKIEEFQPDVIHLHNLHGYYLNARLLLEYLSSTNIKLLWTLHDAWPISGSSAYFDYHGVKLWDDGCVMCNSTKDYPSAVFLTRQRKNFAWKKESISRLRNLTIITPSKWLMELSGKSFLKSFPIEVVHNGINTDVFVNSMKTKDKPKVILGVANIWEQRKGLDDFLELSRKIDSTYQIVLIGLSEKQIELLPKNVHGLTRTSNVAELIDFYSSSYVFVNPTYEDNYPTTNLEALACGTPVIAYDTGGNKEISNEHVIIVEKGDVNGIVKSLEEIGSIDMSTFNRNSLSESRFYQLMMRFYNLDKMVDIE